MPTKGQKKQCHLQAKFLSCMQPHLRGGNSPPAVSFGFGLPRPPKWNLRGFHPMPYHVEHCCADNCWILSAHDGYSARCLNVKLRTPLMTSQTMRVRPMCTVARYLVTSTSSNPEKQACQSSMEHQMATSDHSTAGRAEWKSRIGNSAILN